MQAKSLLHCSPCNLIGIKTNGIRTDSVAGHYADLQSASLLALATGMIAANIKQMGRVALFHKVFSNLVRELDRKHITLSNKYMDYLKHDEDGFNWRLDKDKKEEVLSELGTMLRELLLNYPTALAGTKDQADAERLLGEYTGFLKPESRFSHNVKPTSAKSALEKFL